MKFLPASSIAMLLALICSSANAQDDTFYYQSEDPVVEAKLTAKEEALREFFEEDEVVVAPVIRFTPEATLRQSSVLLERKHREMGEFNDIDDDDLAQLDQRRLLTGQPRLEKPGQLEKDFAIDCPAGTSVNVAGDCVASVFVRGD